MPAYVVIDITVRDRETYERYKQLASSAVAAYGGRYLVRGGARRSKAAGVPPDSSSWNSPAWSWAEPGGDPKSMARPRHCGRPALIPRWCWSKVFRADPCPDAAARILYPHPEKLSISGS
jgi:hypothetical protein